MRKVWLLGVLCLFLQGAAADFEVKIGSLMPTEEVDSKLSDGRVSGVIAPGWRENSEWAKCYARYRAGREGEQSFQRIEIERIDSGYCQFDYRLDRPLPPGEYRIRLRARLRGRARVAVGIRGFAAPYRWHTRVNLLPGGEWTDYEHRFRLSETVPGGSAALFFQIDGVGVFDLASVELTVAEPLRRKLPVNRFRQGSLALGLPTGWSLHNCFSEGDMVKIVPNPDRPGPGGAPSLRIESRSGAMTSYDYRENLSVCIAPFPVEAKQPLRVEFLLAGEAKGKVKLFAATRKIRELPFEVNSPGWKTVALDVVPPGSEPVSAELEFTGVLEIGGLYAGAPEGLRNQPYAEIAPASGDAAEAKIIFTDEPVRLRYFANHVPAGGMLRLEGVNLYGDRFSREVALESAGVASGEVALELPAGRPLGVWRIEAELADGSGKPVGERTELVLNRLPRPKFWDRDAPDSPFGVHVQPSNRHLTMAKALGINWARLHDAGVQLVGWAYLEREPGKWSFDDAGIRRYRDHKLMLHGELTTAPAWKSYAVRSTTPPPQLRWSITAPYFLPLDFDEYEKYAETVISRYRGVISSYDVWNEPWLPLFYHTDYVKKLPEGTRRWASFGGGFYISPDNPAEGFAEMQRRVFRAAAKIDPAIRVNGINSSDNRGDNEGRTSGVEFSRLMKEQGALETCHRICYHQYLTRLVGFPGDEVETGLVRAIGPLLDRDGAAPKPVWFTEGSPLTHLCEGFYRLTAPGCSQAEAFDAGDRVVRFVVSLLAQGNEKVFLYSMGVYYGYSNLNPHRLLVTASGEPHPSGAAFAVMARALEGKKFVRIEPVGERVHAYIFQGDAESCAVLLPDPRSGVYRMPQLPEGVRLSDLFGNPVDPDKAGPYAGYVMVTGEVAALEKALGVSAK